MAFTPHTLVTISGSLGEQAAGDEIWSIGIRGLNPTTAPAPIDPTALDDFLAAITDPTTGVPSWFTGSQANIPSSVKLQTVKVVNIGADGKYTTPPHQVTYNTSGGSAGGPSWPSFLSVAYSWTTARTFGRKLRYGRVYPPNFGILSVPGTATITSAQQTTAVAAAKQLLSAVGKSGSTFVFKPCVMSSSGGFEYITGVRIGNVVDVQRRRKDKVAETYTSSVWP